VDEGQCRIVVVRLREQALLYGFQTVRDPLYRFGRCASLKRSLMLAIKG